MSKRISFGIIGALLLAAIGYSFMPQPIVVEIGPVERMMVREYVTEEAKTRLAEEYILDMPVSGTLERIDLEIGDMVQAGDVVARLDTFELEQRLNGVASLIAQTEAYIAGVDVQKPKDEDLSSAELRIKGMQDEVAMAEKQRQIANIDFENAEREFKRVEDLVKQGVASNQQRDAAERAYRAQREQRTSAGLAVNAARKQLELSQLASSRVVDSVDDNEYMRDVYRAERESLEAQRRVIESDLEKAVIVSPISGPIMEKYLDDRRVLMAGTPLLKIGDLASMEIESDILSEEIGQVEDGNLVEIEGKAVTREGVSGSVKRIYPSAFVKISSLGIEQQRVKTLIDFDEGGLSVRPGTRLDIRIITDESSNTVAVPERATFRREGQWHVFIVDGSTARLTPVRVGLKNDTWAEILEGVEEGDTIVYEPSNDLADGTRITPK